MTVELRVLGSLRLSATDGRDLESLIRQPKRTALLAYLATAVPRGFQRRDTLLALFWPELDDAHARAALNQALYVLRNALGEQAVVTRGADEVGLDHDVIWCDAARFEDAIDGGRPDEALALYGGDLLEGFFLVEAGAFERWLETERARLRQRASEGAWLLAEKTAAEADAVAATRWARRAADLLSADEAVTRRLMTFLHRLGDRAAAIRTYEAFASRINKEYELEPSAETQALALALREEGRSPALVRMVRVPSLSVPTILLAIQRRVPIPWVVASVLAVTSLVAGWAWVRRSEPAPRTVVRFTLQFDENEVMAGGATGSTIALSPNGDRLVYLAEGGTGRQLFLRAMDSLESIPIPHTRTAQLPFFSPDGAWLGFVADGEIWKAPLAGGPAIVICSVGTNVFGASWGPSDEIVFATAAGLWRVAATGGQPRVLALADTATGVRYRWPEVLPSGRDALFTKVDRSGFQLAAVSLQTGEVRELGQEGTSPRFVVPGYVVYARHDGVLLAAPFDQRSPAFTGPALAVAEGVTVGIHGAAKLGVSRFGSLAYVPERIAGRSLVFVDRGGAAATVPLPMRGYHHARLSGDGRRIATSILRSGGQEDIWVVDLERRSMSRVTSEDGGMGPIWTPDNRRIVFATAGAGREPGFAIRWITADGSDSATLLQPADPGQVPLDITPEGRTLLFQRADLARQRDIWTLSLGGERRPELYLHTEFDERAATVSPDGRWLAYVSDESGHDEIYVRAFPVPGPAVRISEGGGHEPRWAPNGHEVFYRAPGGLVAATVATGSALTVGRREVLFSDRPYLAIQNGVAYDVHPDGRRFLMIRRGAESREVVVVLNWFQQLQGRR